MSLSRQISRRTVLRGLGTAMALPFLEAMLPRTARAATVAQPKRLAFVYVPNGAHMPDWTPAEVGEQFALPHILEPLAERQKDLMVLSGLAQHCAFPNGDGPGDHARALASFLTGRQARKTSGADIRIGVSVDQVAAEKIGHQTRFPSLEIGCERGQQAGGCDSGYSCAYSSNISWRTENSPVAKEINPRLVFERLFASSDGGDEAVRRQHSRRSILDFVMEDAYGLQRRLGGKDRRKVDEYLHAIREIELRIGGALKPSADAPPDFTAPAGIPKDYAEHVRLMYDLLALAFQADLTRVATFVVANESSNRPYPFLGVSDGHHDLSHHGGDKRKHEAIRTINRFHVEQFARFLNRLHQTPDGESTLLNQSMILYGSGIGDGDRHNHNNLPILLAGHSGGTLRPGRHLKTDRQTPLNNLFLSLLDRMDASVESLGDSNGRLTEID